MTATSLAKGGNLAVTPESDQHDERFQVVVGWQSEDDVEVDISALLLDRDAQVRSDEDLVFYNSPVGGDGAVRLLGKRSEEARSECRITVDLGSLPVDVERVLIAGSLDADQGTNIGDLEDLAITILDGDEEAVACHTVAGASTETAIALGELYRRERCWKFRVIAQGWDSGLAGLATDYGITVDASPEEQVVEATVPEEQPAVALSSQREAKRRRSAGVRTTKKRFTAAKPFDMKLAGHENWQAARIFSVSGVGPAADQEKRATSVLLSTMMGVRGFGRAISSRLGAPAGAIETFIEVPFTVGEKTVIPDGVIRVARAGRIWTALLETKTGTNPLRPDQVGAYLDVAREQGFDAVVTLSNDITPIGGPHPVAVDARKTRKVALHHLSWADVLHEAQMQVAHHGLDDRLQAWLLLELIRYLEHPRSGAAGFDDMGAAWVPVREALAAGTLRSTDKKVGAVVSSWEKLTRHMCLRLTSQLGAEVTEAIPRKLSADHVARSQASVDRLVQDGALWTALRVPNAAGNLDVVADLRTGKVRTSVELAAPRDGGSTRRVNWMLRQLKDAPDIVTVEVLFHRREQTSCELLKDVRENPGGLLPDSTAEVRAFRLTTSSPLGTKRNGLRRAFIPSVNDAVDSFYSTVVQGLRPWAPTPPKLPADPAESAPCDGVEQGGRVG